VFAEIERFVTGTPAADHGVVRDFAAAFVYISRPGASRRFLFGSGRIRLEPAAGAARLMGTRGADRSIGTLATPAAATTSTAATHAREPAAAGEPTARKALEAAAAAVVAATAPIAIERFDAATDFVLHLRRLKTGLRGRGVGPAAAARSIR
jgi:hypothetical protein